MAMQRRHTEDIVFDLRRYHQRREVCLGLTAREILKAVISLLIPLSLSVFTAVVTLYQQQVAAIQRIEDRQIAQAQREQDLNVSAFQRQQDKLIFQQQRQEDEYRREQDLNISTLQRDLDIHIAETKQLADNFNAEKQREMLLEQRIHDLDIEQQRYDQERDKYLDNLFLSYIYDIGLLVEKHNGSLQNNRAAAALARAKTLNVIRQLGSNRSIAILEFLYDIGQLSISKLSVDLSGAHLYGLDLSNSVSSTMKNISLSGVYLNNASFIDQDVSFWNFTKAHLNGARFTRSNCTHTIFDGANLFEADFSYSTFNNATFKNVNFEGTTFVGIRGMPKQLNYAKFERTNFSHTDFEEDEFQFIDSHLAKSVFRYTRLSNVRFLYSNLTYADFGYAVLENVSFEGSLLLSANFEHAIIKGLINMQYTNLEGANLSGLICSPSCPTLLLNVLSIANAILPNGTLGHFPSPFLPDGYAARIESESFEDIGVWQLTKTPNTSITRARLSSASDNVVFTPDGNNREKRKYDISMYQQINLISNTTTSIDYESLIHSNRAQLTIRSTARWFMGIYVHEMGIVKRRPTNISEHAHRDLKTQIPLIGILPPEEDHQTSFVLNSNTQTLMIIVEFPHRHTLWCEYIDINISPLMKRIPDQ
jgi:uncharacterized protein YjbI with pentapeptide repeats